MIRSGYDSEKPGFDFWHDKKRSSCRFFRQGVPDTRESNHEGPNIDSWKGTCRRHDMPTERNVRQSGRSATATSGFKYHCVYNNILYVTTMLDRLRDARLVEAI